MWARTEAVRRAGTYSAAGWKNVVSTYLEKSAGWYSDFAYDSGKMFVKNGLQFVQNVMPGCRWAGSYGGRVTRVVGKALDTDDVKVVVMSSDRDVVPPYCMQGIPYEKLTRNCFAGSMYDRFW